MNSAIVVCGDREWSDATIIQRELVKLDPAEFFVVHGACRGADTLCEIIAKSLGFVVFREPALWNVYWRRAGPIRNAHMLDHYQPVKVIAFHTDIANSKGTACMMRLCMKRHIPFELISS